MNRRPNRPQVFIGYGDVVGALSAPRGMHHREEQQIVKMSAMLARILVRDEIGPRCAQRESDEFLKRSTRQRAGIKRITKRSGFYSRHRTRLVREIESKRMVGVLDARAHESGRRNQSYTAAKCARPEVRVQRAKIIGQLGGDGQPLTTPRIRASSTCPRPHRVRPAHRPAK